jgi:SAM-dependent methyltransferase
VDLWTSDAFDRAHGTETRRVEPLWFNRGVANLEHGTRYQTVQPEVFYQAIAGIPRESVFVDVGCGKGRVLILACEAKFERVIGVEFIARFARKARRNLRRAACVATVVECDAAQYQFPEGPLTVYLYNPFDATVMEPMVTSLKRRKDPLHVIYVNPVCLDLFSWMKRAHRADPGIAVFTAPGVALSAAG